MVERWSWVLVIRPLLHHCSSTSSNCSTIPGSWRRFFFLTISLLIAHFFYKFSQLSLGMCERMYATKGLHMPKGHMRPIYWRKIERLLKIAMGTRLTLILEQLCWSLLIWMCMFPSWVHHLPSGLLCVHLFSTCHWYIYTWYNSFCCIIIIR